MKSSDIMMELYNIRSLLIASDMATVLKKESEKNSYNDRRWCHSDASNITDVAKERLERLINTIDIDSMRSNK
ncbi:MAG: hypothetical protein K8R91_04325 [Phycisphaerae bacterium]|nr:hypothetical protein [Phycisphaerae bacterium]